MIWDTFLFFNELDLLDLRLNVHSPYVDRFVLVESTYTHQGNPKPLYYYENKAHFEQFNSRIIHIVIDNPQWVGFGMSNPWVNEEEQRNGVKLGLVDAKDEDVIHHSDLDEIVDFSKFTVGPGEYLGLSMRVFMYYVNFYEPLGSWSSNAFHKTRLLEDDGNMPRIRHNDRNRRMTPLVGWHFTYMGGPERVQKKLQSFAHREFSGPKYTELGVIKERIERGINVTGTCESLPFKRIPITEETHPKYLVENQSKYEHLILK
jgi:beta-1,4-mannosyl-glycoprotein beta-1,4-N-acetylglucosaminyltransferase